MIKEIQVYVWFHIIIIYLPQKKIMKKPVKSVKLGKEDAAEQYINENLVVYDIKEGEYSLSAIWQELYARKIAKKRGCDIADVSEKEVFDAYPLPRSLDFRMH